MLDKRRFQALLHRLLPGFLSIMTAIVVCFLPAWVNAHPASIMVNHLMAPQEGIINDKVDHNQHLLALDKTGLKVKTTDALHLSIPNITLVNELGEKVSLIDDLIKDKIVVINTMYTRCTRGCSMMGVHYARLQQMLKRRFGQEKVLKDLVLLSVTLDPLNDSPRMLRAFKNKFKGGPGWSLLTGTSDNIEQLLKATGLFIPDLQVHTPVILVGRVSQNYWTRLLSVSSPGPIALLVDKLMNSPPPLAASQTHNEQPF